MVMIQQLFNALCSESVEPFLSTYMIACCGGKIILKDYKLQGKMEIVIERRWKCSVRNDTIHATSSSMSCQYCGCEAEHQSLVCSNVKVNSQSMLSRRNKCERWIPGRRLIVHTLVIFFGISAWIGVNGIFVQLPLLVNSAPEGWGLPAYLSVLVQAANIGPILYTLSRKYLPNFPETFWIWILLSMDIIAIGLLAFFHDRTSFYGSTEHSTAMFILVFFTALVSCTSSVLFMPYLRDFKEIYLVSYFIGEGLSGVLPSIVALIQGVGGNPECITDDDGKIIPAFGLLRYLPIVQSERINSKSKMFRETRNYDGDNTTSTITNEYNSEIENYNSELETTSATGAYEVSNPRSLSAIYKSYLFIIMGAICFLGHGFLPGIQSYSCLPYGNVAYHLTATLAHMANPAACFLALWTPVPSMRATSFLSIMSFMACSYVILLALKSPAPPMQGSEIGTALVVITWILLVGLISYIKLTITTIFRREAGAKSLFYTGIVMQIGSACGAILSFCFINYTNLFTAYTSCISV
ncbi:riboflavin transporter 2-like isoform X2 [Cephus cinctus]|uniref:Riboflavin transporter n=1 Tax=Cephus cinctus TaxID=211228 RepID=A0AAJ7BLG6_CEPCN|nr:riboflavin transporter 2-like isoform X2 [Cephus cinctus]